MTTCLSAGLILLLLYLLLLLLLQEWEPVLCPHVTAVLLPHQTREQHCCSQNLPGRNKGLRYTQTTVYSILKNYSAMYIHWLQLYTVQYIHRLQWTVYTQITVQCIFTYYSVQYNQTLQCTVYSHITVYRYSHIMI